MTEVINGFGRRKLALQTASSLSVKGLYLISQFGTNVILARILGPGDFGRYAMVLAIVSMIAIAAQLGFPQSIVRLVAVYKVESRYSLLRGLLVRSVQTVSIASLLLILISALLVVKFGVGGQTDSRLILIGLILIPLLALTEVVSCALQGMGHVILGQLPSQVIRSVALISFVGIGYFFFSSFGPVYALTANVGGAFFALISGFFILRDQFTKKFGGTVAETDMKVWVAQAIPFFFLTSAQVIAYQIDVILIAGLADHEQVGLYRVSVQIAESLAVVLMAVTVILAPRLAQLHAVGDWVGIQRLLVLAHRFAILALLPLALTVGLWSDVLLTTLFGRQYEPAAVSLVILVVGKLLSAPICFVGLALCMFGMAKLAILATVMTAGTCIVLNILLIPKIGIVGAAVAAGFGGVFVNLIMALYFYYAKGLDLSALGLNTNKISGSCSYEI